MTAAPHPQGVHILCPEPVRYPTQQKILCQCDSVKALEMGRLSWIIWVTECNPESPYERAAGGFESDKEL